MEILNGTSSVALRSIASKFVSPQELGKIYFIYNTTQQGTESRKKEEKYLI